MITLSLFVVLIYIMLQLWFLSGLDENRENSSLPVEKIPLVTVVAAVRNEERHIIHLLKSLYQQSYPQEKYEIIIANDRSTDNTKSILDGFREKNKKIKTINISEVPSGWAPKKWALHQAIDASCGDLILFTDGDCIPADTWISAVADEFSDPDVGFVSAPSPLSRGSGLLDDIFLMDSLVQDGFSAGGMSRGIVLSCTGRNMAIRREVFDSVNGYDKIKGFTSGDDDLLMQKVASLTKWRVSFRLMSDAIVYSSPPDSIKAFIRQRLRFASKGVSYYRLNTTFGMKMTLPLLYITNIVAVLSMIMVMRGGGLFALLPWGLKSLTDAYYSYRIFQMLRLRWRLRAFLILTVFHPVYITVIGGIGPFTRIRWKDNE